MAFDLSRGVSRFQKWKLATVPTYLSPADVEKVLAACGVATPTGRRDRAIVLLLARLGLRAGEVVTLEVGDRLTGPASVGHIVRKLFVRAGIIRTSRGRPTCSATAWRPG